ncbi:hypothetical protein ColKHC_10787 [Colletotrichum higginsianum]|nr:hypothetical protein ColKHC_10787 [Colletotrichum higginsianum]
MATLREKELLEDDGPGERPGESVRQCGWWAGPDEWEGGGGYASDPYEAGIGESYSANWSYSDRTFGMEKDEEDGAMMLDETQSVVVRGSKGGKEMSASAARPAEHNGPAAYKVVILYC